MLKELDFLKVIAEFETVRGIGDDCAVIEPAPGCVQLISTDMLVEGNHFPSGFADYQAIAEKAVTVNVSDILSSGGQPVHLFISLALPLFFTDDLLRELYIGFDTACRYFNCQISGGDLTSTQGPLVINIAITGSVRRTLLLSRSGARVGDDVYLSGPLGAASQSGYRLDRGYYQLLPTDKIRYIVESKKAHCMTDVSDGLARSLHDISAMSQVGFSINEQQLPQSSGVGLAEVMNGGEDYQVLFTAARTARHVFAEKFTRIGEVTVSRDLVLIDNHGHVLPIRERGYDHFGR